MAKYAHYSQMDPEFGPLVPGIDEAFKSIWEVWDADALRAKFTGTRIPPSFVPDLGFETTHINVPVSDGTEIEIRIYRPSGQTKALPLCFVAHAGGWTTGTHDSEASMNQSVCVKSSAVVVSVDYRRAPEHRFPTALNDCWDVFKWLAGRARELNFDLSRVILAGSSSGANIIAVIALRARDEGIGGIVGQILNVPVVCHPSFYPKDKYELLSYEQNANAPTMKSAHMSWFWAQYMPNPSANPDASPLLATSHKGLPPTLVQVGGLDPLRDEAFAYVDKLRADGVPTTLNIYRGLPHGFFTFSSLSATERYFNAITEWFDALLARLS